MIAALIVLVCALLVFFLAFRTQEKPVVEKNRNAAKRVKASASGNEHTVKRAVLMDLPDRPAARPAASAPASNAGGRQKEQKHVDLLPQIDALYRSASKDKDPFSAQMESCISLCKKDIALAQGCKAYWESENPKGKLPTYPSFARLAIIHEKRNEFDKAAKVCEKAIQLGFVDDGTKGGMQGRLARLQKKKAKVTG